MQFGLQQSRFLFPGSPSSLWTTLKSIAVEAEKSGFHSIWLRDHLMQAPPVGNPSDPVLEGWVALSALAAVTETIRLGHLATCNIFRNPSHLAKMAASLDVISGGRLILGIGAGSFDQEHHAYGFPWTKPAERIRRLEEAVQLIKSMWRDNATTFQGKYYRAEEAICNPKPVQEPRPPILIAGKGEQLTLRVAARHAELCNIGGRDPERLKAAVDALKGHCRAAGRDPREITVTGLCTIIIGEDDQEVTTKIQRYKPKQMSEEEFRKTIIVGTPEECAGAIEEIEGAGFPYLIVNFHDAYDALTLRLFAKVMRYVM